MEKEQVYGNYENSKRKIVCSSKTARQYEAKQYRRAGSIEDPWLGMSDHPNDILYGGAAWGGPNQPHSVLNSTCGGAMVFVNYQGYSPEQHANKESLIQQTIKKAEK